MLTKLQGKGRLAEKARRPATCASAARRTPDPTKDLEMWHPSMVVAQLRLASPYLMVATTSTIVVAIQIHERWLLRSPKHREL